MFAQHVFKVQNILRIFTFSLVQLVLRVYNNPTAATNSLSSPRPPTHPATTQHHLPGGGRPWQAGLAPGRSVQCTLQ